MVFTAFVYLVNIFPPSISAELVNEPRSSQVIYHAPKNDEEGEEQR